MSVQRAAFSVRTFVAFSCLSFSFSAIAETSEFRSIDGSGNNPYDSTMNSAHTPLMRHMNSSYDDGVAQMSGSSRPNPRSISNSVNHQDEQRLNQRRLSSFFWLWGQFLDHDIDLTEGATPLEAANVAIPAGDPWFDPANTGNVSMQFSRSEYSVDSGTGLDNPREQMNGITGWIDASMVYGSNPARAQALRTNDGSGKLKTSAGRLMPFNTDGFANAGGTGPHLFFAGDVRANENIGLTAMHTVFVREHNRLARRIRKLWPHLSGEDIYQHARYLVGAEIQMVTYEEFLPALLGRGALPRKISYNPIVTSTIRNEFSTAAYRLGHSLLTEELPRLDRFGREAPEGNIALAAAFFAPHEIADHGIESVLRGMAVNPSQDVDVYITDAVRNFLFGGAPGGFDLATLNIQRGRDHGLPAYNEARASMGLPKAEAFSDISSDPEVQERLAAVYSTPDDVDLWVGGLAEDHVRGAVVGELFHGILLAQFAALAQGDRYFYQNNLSYLHRWLIGNPKLGAIIRRNTRIGRELSNDAFHTSRRGRQNGRRAPYFSNK